MQENKYDFLSREDLIGVIKSLESELNDVGRIQQQLIQTEKLVALGGLVSGVAHEINNPLAIISGYSELLLNDSDLNEAQQKKVNRIYESGLRCAEIVKKLLGFARETDIDKKELDINKVVSDTLGMVEHEVRLHNIVIIREFGSSLPCVFGDFQMLQQVFLNFVNNASDAIKENRKPGKIFVKTRSDEQYVTIEISDNGPGVNAEIRDKLFDPFFTTKSPGTGTGLGLSLSFGVIKEHNGKVYLDQSYDEGAKFVIKLPAVEEAADGKGDNGTVTDERARILVVDDEREITEFIQEVLEHKNYYVQVASSGEEAKNILEKEKFSLALFDVRMPGSIDGMDLYSIVMKDHKYLKNSVIFVTGDTLSTDISNFFAQNSLKHIQKPFQIRALLELIEKSI